MDLSISFRNADPSRAMSDHIERRARSLEGKLQKPYRLRAVCGYDGALAEVDLVATIHGRVRVAHGEADDMYDAADRAFDRLAAQLFRDHERRSRRRFEEDRVA